MANPINISFKICFMNGAVVASASLGDIQYSYNKDPLQPYEFEVNRPLFFFIKEHSTDVCVLSGLITHP